MPKRKSTEPRPIDINPDVAPPVPTETAPPEASSAHKATASPPAEDARARQSAAPCCPYHPDQRCKSRGSTPFFTRYYCPVAGCGYAEKKPRPRIAPAREEEDFSAR